MQSDPGDWFIASVETSFSNEDQNDMDNREQKHRSISQYEPPTVRSRQPVSQGTLDGAVTRAVQCWVIGEKWVVVAVEIDEVSHGNETIDSDKSSNSKQEQEHDCIGLGKGGKLVPGPLSALDLHSVSGDETVG